MTFFSFVDCIDHFDLLEPLVDLFPHQRLATAASRLYAGLGDCDVTESLAQMSDSLLLEGMQIAGEAHRAVYVLIAAIAAEVDRRSARGLGYQGLAQRKGHRTAADLVQSLTGQTRADVNRSIEAGKDLAAAHAAQKHGESGDSRGEGTDGGPDDADGGGPGSEPSGHGGTDQGASGADGTRGAPSGGGGRDGDDGDGTAGAAPGDDAGTEGDRDATSHHAPAPWFTPLTEALQSGRLSREQYDAIRRGLGEPPVERYPELAPDFLPRAWRKAACTLIDDAEDRSVEDLASDARLARDTLDPIGTQLRFEERFRKRSFRTWVDADGQRHAHIAYDDDAAAWVQTILNAALRPRRGPRFVDPEARAAAKAAAEDDTRTNAQLQYDTIMAVLRTGAAADPMQAFGDRQPGVRVIVTAEALEPDTEALEPDTDTCEPGADTCEPGADACEPDAGADAAAGKDHAHAHHAHGVAFYEETMQAIPATMAEKYLCDAGSKPITVDSCGTPLDVGRESRLFTPKQRVALALRDGGCLWCGAEPSRCEAHHLNPWALAHGRTDLADGILLCRNCHMRLHNQGWWITRVRRADGSDDYWLHPPGGGEARLLRPRNLTRFAHAG